MVTTLTVWFMTLIVGIIDDDVKDVEINLLPFMLIDFIILYIIGVIYGVFPPIA